MKANVSLKIGTQMRFTSSRARSSAFSNWVKSSGSRSPVLETVLLAYPTGQIQRVQARPRK